MHICLVHAEYPPVARIGGIVRYLELLAPEIARSGHQVSVITLARDGTESEVDSNPRILRIREPRISKLVPGISGSLLRAGVLNQAVRRLDRRETVDIVEWTNFQAEGIWHSYFPVAPHVTRVVTMRWQWQESIGRQPQGPRDRLSEHGRNWLEAAPLRRSTLLLSPTAAHASSVASRIGGKVPIVVANLGSRAAPSTGRERASANRLQFLFVGKLDERKGIDTLVEAFDRYAVSGGPPADLILCGDDSRPTGASSSPFEAAIAAAQPETRESVRVLGYQPDSALPGLYGSADVLLAPSRFESFGLMITEAMQQGTPSIACDVGGLPEVITSGHDGILVPPSDPGALAAAMLTLAKDDQLRLRLGEAARRTWYARFSQRTMADHSIAAYDRARALWRDQKGRGTRCR